MTRDGLVNLDLNALGDLNKEVVALMPAMVRSLEDAKAKGRITITIEFKRLENSESAVVVGYSVKPTYPKRGQKILCRTDLVGNLRTEADPHGYQISILQAQETKEKKGE